MLIDWFTVVAQAVNFLILVWLMRRFLYTPILNAIDAREKLIEKKVSGAASKMTDATAQLADYKDKNEKFEEQRKDLLQKATDEAKTERQRLVEAARQEGDDLRNKQHKALADEQVQLSAAVSLRAKAEVFSIARKALADLSSSSLENSMIDVFGQRLRALDPAAKETLKAAFTSDGEKPVVRTTFELAEPEKVLVRQLVAETFGTENSLQFETSPSLVSGIELTANGEKIAWSIQEYLRALDDSVSELLTKPAVPAKT
jgi:F-type H+-transporting ATPase subunit b